jgi:hypothetical protein
MDLMIGEPKLGCLIAEKHPAGEGQRQNQPPRPGFAKGLLHGAVISYDFRSFRKTNFKSEEVWTSRLAGTTTGSDV